MVLNNFKNRLFPIKNLKFKLEEELELELEQELWRKPKPKYRIFSLISHENFLNEIVTEESYINEEIFRSFFKYQNQSSLAKDLLIKDLLIKLIKLMEDINTKQSLKVKI